MNKQEFMTAREVRDFLGLGKNTLAKWRARKVGPQAHKSVTSGRYFYRRQEVEEFSRNRLKEA